MVEENGNNKKYDPGRIHEERRVRCSRLKKINEGIVRPQGVVIGLIKSPADVKMFVPPSIVDGGLGTCIADCSYDRNCTRNVTLSVKTVNGGKGVDVCAHPMTLFPEIDD